ncbi:MAG TPA: bacteriohemerythrin [Steroidobacteraceae bacterium]|nr:hemerythrin family protein [Gammaproteobacteria bacterium]HEV2286831.1 bacteriohemerythrin [Steroidobacteraceae bacterium]
MSDYFQWDASRYGLNVPAMDHEHETLIGHMNAVHALHTAGAGRAALGPALEKLVAYTRRHFEHEEAYMEQIGFPGLRLHAGVHRQLLARVGEFAAEFARTGALSEEFFMFLRMWLKAHICGIDAKYVPQAKTG